MEHNWYAKTIPEALALLRSNEQGLTEGEALRRLKEGAPNKLPEAKPDNLAVVFLRQFQSPLIYILLAASAAVFMLDETVDASIILAILIFNAIVGTIQEGRAQHTLQALKRFVETKATVVRGGKEFIISDTEVVPGDIIVLFEGEKVPADARVILSKNLKLDEAALTGESQPVHKITDALDQAGLSTIDQENIAFKGTNVVSGEGKALVVAVGINTAIGKIARAIAVIDTEIPLKDNLRYLSRLIILVVVAVSAILFTFGLAAGTPMREIFATVVSLAVSVIPEGLPIVITLVLATGVWRMSKRNALVKKLHAVEALGQVQVIAVDKTGTVTKNEMTIQKVYVDGKVFEIEGVGYGPQGNVRQAGVVIDSANHPELLFIGKAAAFCASARVLFSEESRQWRVAGDPTEAAMLVLARKLGFHKDILEQESPLVAEIPFDYHLKYHATSHRVEGAIFSTVVGAPEVILEYAQKIRRDGREQPLSIEERSGLHNLFTELSREGLRVLAVAVSAHADETLRADALPDLTFVGFFAMKDALRLEVREAMDKATEAGVRVVMITGDHMITAQAIAEEAGIYHKGDKVLTGEEVDKLSDKELSERIAPVSVFARVSPEHKLRIINAYKARGEIIAMTGDGVNDAPSLSAANLGVAMGTIGTEVAKEASDIILLDDNFGSIVAAIEEGRSIYKTIKKVVLYLFSTSAGEVLTIVGALALGFPLPLLPAQIIWLNFVTDGFLDTALAMEPKDPKILRHKFERPKKYLVDKLMAWRMFLMALPMAIGTLYLFKDIFEADLAKAWTVSLTVLAVFQWFNAWNCRSGHRSIFSMSPFSNKFLLGATLIVISLQMLVLYNPVAQKLLHTVPLSLSEWGMIIAVASSIIIIEEIRKFFYRKTMYTTV